MTSDPFTPSRQPLSVPSAVVETAGASQPRLNPTESAMAEGLPKGPSSAQRSVSGSSGVAYTVLTGNPNCGKTTLFNALTGLRAKVGNYAGVTVERKEGPLVGAPREKKAKVIDLPGTYSLSPQSMDEQVSRDVLLQRLPELPAPAAVVVVVDASNLQRNLYYATQVIELGYPTILALNMIDVAESNGHRIDASALARELGVPVVPVVASEGKGLPELRREILAALERQPIASVGQFCNLPPLLRAETEALAELFPTNAGPSPRSRAPHSGRAAVEALLILCNEKALASGKDDYPPQLQEVLAAARGRLEAAGIDWRSAAIESRYARVSEIQRAVTTETAPPGETVSDRLDRVLTHKVWGTAIFLVVMLLMFQSIFTFARLPMNGLQTGVQWLGEMVGRVIPPGDLNSLLVDGVIAGVGAVVVFLPQILLLFLFIGFLEDTGYMARAAFLMDRLMSKVGLHGKSFIPMLSSFACAIPGIMATRTIESPKDRLVTILICPLMSCSARLPVYTVLIAACIPNLTFLGFLRLPGLTLLGMYLLGILAALVMAWVFKKTLLKSDPPLLIMELPPYKMPLLRVVARHMWDRGKVFLRQAGTVILGINIVLWFLATYPRNAEVRQHFAQQRAQARAETAAKPSPTTAPADSSVTPAPAGTDLAARLTEIDREEAGQTLRDSFAGRLGRLIEPAITPLGFDWRMGIGIVSSFAAREVFVSTMSTVYNVGKDPGHSDAGIVKTLQTQRRPDGTLVYTPLLAVTLMVFYVFALQCVSTLAIVRRETNSWKWPLFQWFYLGTLAWTMAFLTWHLGHWMGYA